MLALGRIWLLTLLAWIWFENSMFVICECVIQQYFCSRNEWFWQVVYVNVSVISQTVHRTWSEERRGSGWRGMNTPDHSYSNKNSLSMMDDMRRYRNRWSSWADRLSADVVSFLKLYEQSAWPTMERDKLIPLWLTLDSFRWRGVLLRKRQWQCRK